MNKKSFLILLLVTSFTVFLSADSSTAKTFSPENSVIFYGKMKSNVENHYFQCNSKFPADYQKFSDEIFISSPVPLNSCYRLAFVRGKSKAPFDILSRFSGAESIWEKYYSLQNKAFDILIPSKPGLYYVGSFDGEASFLKGEYVLSEENQKAEEVEILSAVLKKYKGTEWEVLVKARIEEIKNGI